MGEDLKQMIQELRNMNKNKEDTEHITARVNKMTTENICSISERLEIEFDEAIELAIMLFPK